MKQKEQDKLNTSNNFLLYTNQDGEVKVDVLLKDENIWLTMNQMAELFGIDKSGISRHIKNVFETGELQQEATVAKIATVQNKLIYATTGNTAAEVIAQRSDDLNEAIKNLKGKA